MSIDRLLEIKEELAAIDRKQQGLQVEAARLLKKLDIKKPDEGGKQ